MRNFANPRAKTRHPRRTKLAAARSAAANFVRRLCRVFARGFVKLRVNFQASVAIIDHLSNTRMAPGGPGAPWERVTGVQGAEPPAGVWGQRPQL